jgi:transcriptional regulator with XRE-family HTH domain
MDTFGTLLNKHLNNHNMTIEQLAHSTGIPKDSLDIFVGGSQKPHDCEAIKQIAGALKLSSNDRRALFKAAELHHCFFADLLDEYMKRVHITQINLAKDIGVKRETIGRWLKAEHLPGDCEPLYRCADVLKLSMLELNALLEASRRLDCQQLSPCVVGQPIDNPKQFFGRQDEIKRILDQWSCSPLLNLAIMGPQGSGKTSLLYRLRCHDKISVKQAIFVNFKDPRMREQKTFISYVLKQLEIPIPKPCHLNTFLSAMTDYLDLKKQPTFIFLDDVDRGLTHPSLDRLFWDGLRALGSDGQLAFLATSRKKPSDVEESDGKSSPFFNIFGQAITLGPLSETEARELLKAAEKSARLELPYDAKAWEWILEKSQKWPMLLQKMANCYINAMKYDDPKPDQWQKACLEREMPSNSLY